MYWESISLREMASSDILLCDVFLQFISYRIKSIIIIIVFENMISIWSKQDFECYFQWKSYEQYDLLHFMTYHIESTLQFDLVLSLCVQRHGSRTNTVESWLSGTRSTGTSIIWCSHLTTFYNFSTLFQLIIISQFEFVFFLSKMNRKSVKLRF